MKRILRIDVCDYSDTILCNLYDSQTDVSGGAVNVFIDTERNGWKELTFSIPSVILTEEGEEENYRLEYLKGDYRLRVDDGEEIDYYLLSEPKIVHNAFSKNVDVRAGHIAQILKTKNLDLEFSDEEGNNGGTADLLLAAILEGSSWKPGHVEPFKERDGSPKYRTFTASAGTGCLAMIESLCDLFEAKPIYHGATRTVDLVPMNPFSDVDAGEIPTNVRSQQVPVHELHYERNIHDLTRTLNTDNIATRLYGYGSSGDTVTGACTLQNASHDEYSWKASKAGTYFSFKDTYGTTRFFSGDVAKNNVLIWSTLDPTSESYIWNDTKNKAYHLSKTQNGTPISLGEPTIKSVQNYVPYLLGFNYYDQNGLLTEDMFQDIAAYQRDMPALNKTAYKAGQAFVKKLQEFNELANPISGFLKLAVTDHSTKTRLFIDDAKGNNGVLYRSDYASAERRYFQWHVGKDFKPNGLPQDNIGSIVIVIHKEVNGVRKWDMGYITEIYLPSGKLVDENGNPKAYDYGDNSEYPSSITINTPVNYASGDDVYLFCTNSMLGKLGIAMSGDETVLDSIDGQTTTGTEKHPVLFTESGKAAPLTSIITYGWNYRYTRDTNMGTLYFNWKGKYGDTSWNLVHVQDTEPSGSTTGEFFFDTKYRTLSRYDGTSWVKYESVAEQEVARLFSSVLYFCRQRDYYYKGVYEDYICEQSLKVGNYAIDSGFDFYYTFSTDRDVTKLRLNTTDNRVYQNDDSTNNIVSVSVVQADSAQYPAKNEISSDIFSAGTLDTTSGIEVDSSSGYRSGDIMVHENTTYKYKLPKNSGVILYTISKKYQKYLALGTKDTFDTDSNTYYVRFITPVVPDNTAYLQVEGYNKIFYLKNQPYQIISATQKTGSERLGINNMMKKFVTLADATYGTYRAAQEAAQNNIKVRENGLSEVLGDLLRDGRWSDENYVKGDETRLYEDAIDIVKEISMPETSYEFTYLDLFGANEDLHYYEEHDVPWPDIQITDAAHLVDPDIGINCWAYIDKIHKCYDQPWLTTIEVDTKLTLQSRHEFKDILARIAEVAKATKSKQSIYDRAKALGLNGSLPAQRLEGMIALSQTQLNGGVSNWFTDERGNIILEAADGNSAMILGGRGLGVATAKNSAGDWDWRLCATGNGLTADAIYTGYLSGSFIEAGTITAEQLMSNVGQQLDIGSNKSLLLFATTNGSRPAGTVKTTDAKIEIKAGSESGSSVTPAQINVVSGGELNMQGSTVNITTVGKNKGKINIASGGELNLEGGSMSIKSNGALNVSGGSINVTSDGALDVSSGKFTLKAGKSNVSDDGDGLYIGDDGINYFGLFKLFKTGTPPVATVYLDANYVQLGNMRSSVSKLSEAINATYRCNRANIIKQDYKMGDTWRSTLPADNHCIFTCVHVTAEKTLETIDTDWERASTTFSCTPVAITSKNYRIGDIWSCTEDITTDGTTYRIGYQYVCVAVTKTISEDWTITKASDITGASLVIDANAGTINMEAANTITLKTGSAINIASGGKVTIGNSTKPFTFGAVTGTSARAFLYNLTDAASGAAITGNPSVATTASGIYLGTDGIYVGTAGTTNGQYVRIKASGDVEVKGDITATSGKIGAWTINANSIYAGKDKTDESGKIVSSDYVRLHGLGTDYDGGSVYAFWAGRQKASDAPFWVKKDGTIKAASGTVGGWVLGSNLLGDAATLNECTVGVRKGTSNGSLVFFAGANGEDVTTATFKVTKAGKLTATNAVITGDVTATSGTIGGWTMSMHTAGTGGFLYSGSGSTKVELDSSNKEWTYTMPIDKSSYSRTKSTVAMWAGAEDPESAPFSVTKDGVVTLKRVRVKLADNSFAVVDMQDWIGETAGGSGDDAWTASDVGEAMGKLKFMTVKNITKKGNGSVTIVLAKGGGGTSVINFNTAASVKISNAAWSGTSGTTSKDLRVTLSNNITSTVIDNLRIQEYYSENPQTEYGITLDSGKDYIGTISNVYARGVTSYSDSEEDEEIVGGKIHVNAYAAWNKGNKDGLTSGYNSGYSDASGKVSLKTNSYPFGDGGGTLNLTVPNVAYVGSTLENTTRTIVITAPSFTKHSDITPIGNHVRFKRHITSSEKPTGYYWYSLENPSTTDYSLEYYVAGSKVTGLYTKN